MSGDAGGADGGTTLPPPRTETVLTHAGRDPVRQSGAINPPVYRMSTVAFPSLAAQDAAYADRFRNVVYGRYGTPTTAALEAAITALEGGHRAVVFPSGLAACVGAIDAFVRSGDHLLVTDSVYGPVRRACDLHFAQRGVRTTYYDPRIGAGIADLLESRTRVVYLESPGSLTFEVQDVPAIAAVAHERGIVTIMDNTWATPLFFRPLERGVDVVVESATKYIGGHSDLLLGLAVARDAGTWAQLKKSATLVGHCAGPDDVWLALRGLRTLAVRLRQHERSALAVAGWLRERAEVAEVLHPGLPGTRDHELWRRDFDGASGLFAVALAPVADAALAAMVDGLRYFAIGASWGGFESLALWARPQTLRTARPWTRAEPVLRLHIGLEDTADLIADLDAGFARLRAASEAAAR